jgi:DNA-binding transcriptional LysR family regulator
MSDIVMDDIRGIDLNLLVVLDVLLEERSVTRAATRLHVTQSTVSGMLARLRDALGDPLFVRTRSGIAPTPRAEAMAGPLRAWLLEARALVAPTRFDASRWDAAVAIGATDYTQHVLFPGLVRTLRERAPRLRLAVHALVFAEAGERLGSGAFDLVVTAAGWAPPGLPSRLLCRERYVLAMAAGHPLASRRRIGVRDFCAYDHVLVSPSGGAFAGPVDEMLAARGHRRSVRYSVPSFALVPDLLAGTDLLSVLPERLVAGRRDLRTYRPPIGPDPVEMVAVWHPRLDDDPAHRWLRETLAEAASAV